MRRQHRRGKKRRRKLRLALRLVASIFVLAVAAALSAGMIHVVERPMPPFEVLADQLPKVHDPTMPIEGPQVVLESARDAQLEVRLPLDATPRDAEPRD